MTTVVLDLDGVVRHFDHARRAAVEARHRLAEGALAAAAFETKLIEAVTTGQITRVEWVRRVGDVVDAPAAAEEWLADRGTVDPAMLAEVHALRELGVTVAILTNGTDTIPAEMVELGLDGRFDAIFNSAEIGFAKPDRRVFEFVCGALEVEPSAVFFTDDTVTNLSGAIEIGIDARLFEGVELFRQHLAELDPGTR